MVWHFLRCVTGFFGGQSPLGNGKVFFRKPVNYVPQVLSMSVADLYVLRRFSNDLGLLVIPWTVNDRSEMARLIDLGVDGIISDYPDRLRGVMAEKNLPLPAPVAVD